MANTGRKIFNTLLKVSTVNNAALDVNNEFCSLSGLPQATKPNTPGDLNYIGPIQDLTLCPIPVKCVLSAWSAWSVCSGNTRTRTRTVITPASYGGTACGPLTETEACGETAKWIGSDPYCQQEEEVVEGNCYSLIIPTADVRLMPVDMFIRYKEPNKPVEQILFSALDVSIEDSLNTYYFLCSEFQPVFRRNDLDQVWIYDFESSPGACQVHSECTINLS
jgi:hypothetical protein